MTKVIDVKGKVKDRFAFLKKSGNFTSFYENVARSEKKVEARFSSTGTPYTKKAINVDYVLKLELDEIAGYFGEFFQVEMLYKGRTEQESVFKVSAGRYKIEHVKTLIYVEDDMLYKKVISRDEYKELNYSEFSKRLNLLVSKLKEGVLQTQGLRSVIEQIFSE